MIPLPNKSKLRHKGPNDVVELSAYIPAICSKFKISDEAAKKTLTSIRGGEGALETEEAGENKKLKAAFSQMKTDWAAHVKNKAIFEAGVEKEKAAAKAKRESDKAESVEKKASYALALTSSLEDETLVSIARDTQAKMDEALSVTLGEKFKIKNNKVIIAKGAKPTIEDYGHAFAAFINVVEAGEAFSDSAAKREAQLGMLAEAQFGEDWVNMFGDRSKDIARISKYMKAYAMAAELEVEDVLTAMPLGNFRAISEVLLVAGDKEANIEAKKKLFAHMSEKFGDDLPITTQSLIRKEVNEYKTSLGLKAELKHNFICVFRLGDKVSIRQAMEVDEAILREALFVFNRKLELVSWNDETNKPVLVTCKVLTSKDKAAFCASFLEEKKEQAAQAETSSKKKPFVTKKPGSDDDEDEAPAKPAPKKVAAVVVEDDDDDEDEAPTPKKTAKKAAPVVDDDDDEDEAPTPKSKKKAPVVEDEDEDEDEDD